MEQIGPIDSTERSPSEFTLRYGNIKVIVTWVSSIVMDFETRKGSTCSPVIEFRNHPPITYIAKEA